MTETRITAEAAAFVSALRYEDLSEAALAIGRRCVLDGLGQFAAGADTTPVRIVAEDAAAQGGRPEARLLGHGATRVPAPLAARVLGTAGHAMDWDDTQATRDPRHTYGLLTHPTVPPLAAGLALAQAIGPISGRAFMTAFQAGFEIECKIAEWMLPDAYRRGLHASAAEGTLGAAATCAKLMDLDEDGVRRALGIAASLSSAGIRANVGTETKPLHFGRAAENGLTAALLARRGLDSGAAPLDGAYGFLGVFGGGWFEEKLSEGFGRTLSIVDPGVSVKPYPSGILSHQAMDALLLLVEREDLRAAEVAQVRFFAGSNILNPLGYPIATNHLEAKFCMPALLGMILLRRRAGKQEFTDAFIASDAMQDLQKRCETRLDPEIEAQGFDRIRSRIEVEMRDGRVFTEAADERYRGSPEQPMTDADLERKLRDATDGVLSADAQDRLIGAAWAIDSRDVADVGLAAGLLEPEPSQD
jgi:2-methylcitrate dehydratase PrpD